MSEIKTNLNTLQLSATKQVRAIRKTGSTGEKYLAYDGTGWYRLESQTEIDLAAALFHLAEQMKGKSAE